jgi:hypothetical protein
MGQYMAFFPERSMKVPSKGFISASLAIVAAAPETAVKCQRNPAHSPPFSFPYLRQEDDARASIPHFLPWRS